MIEESDMESTTTETGTNSEQKAEQPADAQAGWQDVAAASANATTREEVEDVIEVKLTEHDLADIARANAADDDEKNDLESELEDLKGEVKEKREAIAAVEARMKDRHRAVLKGSQSRKGRWIVENVYAQNAVKYIDPITGRVVLERAMTSADRQIDLPIATTAHAADTSAGGVAADADGDVEPSNGVAVTDPDALLAAAERADEELLDSEDDDDAPDSEEAP